jgi:hypothetical protein
MPRAAHSSTTLQNNGMSMMPFARVISSRGQNTQLALQWLVASICTISGSGARSRPRERSRRRTRVAWFRSSRSRPGLSGFGTSIRQRSRKCSMTRVRISSSCTLGS